MMGGIIDENPMIDATAASLVSISESPTSKLDDFLEPITHVVSSQEGPSEMASQDDPISLPQEQLDASSPEKLGEVHPIENIELKPTEVKEIETPHLFENQHIETDNSDGAERTSLDRFVKADEAVQVVDQPTASTVGMELSEPEGSTHTNEKSYNGFESNVLNDVQPVNTSDGGLISLKQEVHEGKPQPPVLPQPSSKWQRARETAAKSQSASNSTAKVNQIKAYSGLVDTAAPFESVKEAVSKFGGIVDWKAHKAQTMKRHKLVQLELQKVHEEIPQYKKKTEEAEDAKKQVLEELQYTKRFIEELKLNLEKLQTEEAQAKQDAELAQLRVKEMEQGIAGEASVAVKAQLDIARSRYATAVTEVESTRAELKSVEEELTTLIVERDNAIRRAEEAVSASINIEKTVEDLTLELITAREALEAAQTAHMEAEEHRIGAALAKDQDSLTWEKELKQAEEELRQLNERHLSTKDLQLKIDNASTLLLNLKAELASYMEAKLTEESELLEEDKQKSESRDRAKTHADVQATVVSVQKEIEEVKSNIEKAKVEVEILKVAAVSLRSELKTERAALASMHQREGMASIAVSSLEAEVKRTLDEIEAVQVREKEARDLMLELPKALQQAAREAEEAKSAALLTQEDFRKVKEEEEQLKGSMSTLQSRLNAAYKEIEAVKASERLALAAVKALEESEQGVGAGLNYNVDNWVTLPLDEYYALSKRAHDAEDEAGERVATAISQVEVAKQSELKSLQRLEDALKELSERKEKLRFAAEKAELAKQGKLAAEQELREWRADNMQRRKGNNAPHSMVNPPRSPRKSFEESKSFATIQEVSNIGPPMPSTITYASENDAAGKLRKKKSLFPRIALLLGGKKDKSSKN